MTLGLIRIIPMFSVEYKMETLETLRVPPDNYRYYYDLNGDGISEMLNIYYNASENLSISISNITSATINQFNLPGRLIELGPTLDLHDIDFNGIVDVFVCTEKNDSLFLTIIDDLYGHPTTTKKYFLDKINQFNDNGDYLYSPGGITDLNRDGSPEYVMGINGGHSLQPRRVYAIDYKNDTVLKSPLSGAAVVSLNFFDLDNDGSDEILLNTVAPENFKTHIPYRDSISWLMVLDKSLRFYRPPLKLNGPPSRVSIEPFQQEGKNYLMVYHKYNESDDYHAIMAIYDDSLHMIKSNTVHGQKKSATHMYRIPGRFDLQDIKFLNNNGIYTYNFNLESTDSLFNESYFDYNTAQVLDVDADGENEYVFRSLEKIYVFRSDFRESASLAIQINARYLRTFISIIEDGDAYPKLFAQIGTDRITSLYMKNKWYQFRKLVYPGIFILLYGLFYLLTFLQTKLVARRYEKDKLINRLQLQSIKNQLDPHFTYNALNAVGSLIYKEKKDLAYQYLKGLTDLLRMVSGDVKDLGWTLADELEFIRKYMEIEKLRFREKFNYSIEVESENLKDRQVPKMSVLTFVENAIKHGLRNKQDVRQLEVEVTRDTNGMKIGIRDNGIGRAAAAQYNGASTGHGIQMMKLYLKQFSETTGKNARFKIIDLFDSDLKAAGTLVELIIL